MPNAHGQITEEDFKALEGKFRIMKESMSDGDLEIVADFTREPVAIKVAKFLQEDNEEDVFTVYDDEGKSIPVS